ncbi:hypothetical protein [Paenibacillus dendritiformis]|uniref:hypothetical protein n=1 Tax=Paenibacillus dendritiformis TaxID=130049 RepID=UPI00387E1F52
MTERLRCFLGKPIAADKVSVYSPTVDQIGEIGEPLYNLYLLLATFDKEEVVKRLFSVDDDDWAQLEAEDDFLLLCSIPALQVSICDALRFFTRREFIYDEDVQAFVSDEAVIDRHNYRDVVHAVKLVNGIAAAETPPVRFKNEKAKELYAKLQHFKAKHARDNDNTLHLKDILSILCHAEGNGIHIFNVGELTIYQVYEHFERLNVRERHTRLLKVWANGYLGRDESLPEWMTRSKL